MSKKDRGTPELHKKGGYYFNQGMVYNGQQLYIDWLANNSYITPAQHEAGKAIYSLWYKAGMPPRISLNLDAVRVDGGKKQMEQTEHMVDCQQQLDQALATLERTGREIVMAMCCYEVLAVRLDEERNIPRKYIMQRLREALIELAYHFGYLSRQAYENHHTMKLLGISVVENNT